jgi:excisionase family DNA binding protein
MNHLRERGDLPEVLTVPEVMAVLRLSRNSVYAAIRAGEIPVVRIGRRLLVPRVRLEQLLESDRPDQQTDSR